MMSLITGHNLSAEIHCSSGFCGRQQHAYWAGGALITDDGGAIEGDALDDVRMVGVVTHTISPVWVDNNPVM